MNFLWNLRTHLNKISSIILRKSNEMDLTFWQTISIKIQDVHEANRHENLLKLRVSLSTFDPPIAKVIEVGLVPILVNRLETER